MKSRSVDGAWKAVVWILTMGLMLVPALAESDGFVSNAGVFDYLSPPDVRPQENVQPHDGWIGVYYAPGVGLEMNIWDLQEGEGILHCSVVNYANPDEVPYNRINASIMMVDEGMKDVGDGFILRDFHDGIFTMEINDSWLSWLDARGTPIYGGPTTIEFTDVTKLMANPVEDRFGGAYFYDYMEDISGTPVYSGMTFYLSFVQLYGTSDYYLVEHREVDGREMTDQRFAQFLVESDGALIHNYGYSVVTGQDYIERYELRDAEPQKIVCQYAGDDGSVSEYYWCSSKPMWRE